MSNPARDSTLGCLFSDPERKLDNIKFFRRSDVAISPTRFKQEVCASADRRKAKGAIISRTPPASRKQPIDLREIVADM